MFFQALNQVLVFLGRCARSMQPSCYHRPCVCAEVMMPGPEQPLLCMDVAGSLNRQLQHLTHSWTLNPSNSHSYSHHAAETTSRQFTNTT